jgi:hypothetical protein
MEPQVASDRLPPFLRRTVAQLRCQFAEGWRWMASTERSRQAAETARLDLLRGSVRLDRQSSGRVYAIADQAAQRLQVRVPLTIYHAAEPMGGNAGILLLPDSAHIVLDGPLEERSDDDDLLAVMGHELGHWQMALLDDRAYWIASQLLNSILSEDNPPAVIVESARRLALFAEVFCDRCSLHVVGNLEKAVAGLVKAHTQAKRVDAAEYLRQADEVLRGPTDGSHGWTHPELYIRAKSLQVWHEEAATGEPKVARWINGPLTLRSMDLLEQSAVHWATFGLVERLMEPAWMKTLANEGLRKIYFPDNISSRDQSLPWASIQELLRDADLSVHEYLAYVLLDFASADRTLEEQPLAWAFELAEQLSIESTFDAIAKKDLKLRVKQLQDIKQNRHHSLAQAAKVVTA